MKSGKCNHLHLGSIREPDQSLPDEMDDTSAPALLKGTGLLPFHIALSPHRNTWNSWVKSGKLDPTTEISYIGMLL
jgi:hypothetical protein